MSRKRVNISVDPKTYEKLQGLVAEHGFKNACELVVSLIHILLDRLQRVGERRHDLPEDDGAYIDEMFDELGNVGRQPRGEVPKGRKNGYK